MSQGAAGAGGLSSRHSDSVPAESVCASPVDDEWTVGRILAGLQSGSVSTLESLAGLAVTGELRDYDDLFASSGSGGAFYVALMSALRAAWKANDHAVLGGVGDDEHENFLYEQHQHAQAHRAPIVDDEEDEEHGTPDALSSTAWRRLAACYTLVTRVLAFPEFNPTLASSRRGAVDGAFCTGLVARFEPKFAKSSKSAIDTRMGGSLTSVTGVGGVAMGSLGATMPGSGSSGLAPSARGGQLSTVGIGVKFAEPDSPLPAELALLRGLLHSIYAKFPGLRPSLRHLLANFLTRYLRQPSHPQGVNEILSVYGAIAKGFAVPIHPQHREFLLKYIMPLHQPNQMLNELAPVISAYHESLVYVLTQFLQKDALSSTHAPHAPNGLCETIITRILLGWPNAQAACSPKEVLLLHECEKILEFCPTNAHGATTAATATDATAEPSAAASAASSSSSSASSPSAFHRIIGMFLPYLLSCITSYNHRVAERALQLWQNDQFRTMCRDERRAILPVLLPCLVQSEPHWNKSVNKMRGIVLGLFRDMDTPLFMAIAHQHLTSMRPQSAGLPPPSSPQESLQRVDALIAQLRPPESDLQPSAEQRLLSTQVRVASALPTVKYSEFVFGHVLGSGSFSSVRYAKWVKKGQLPSQWPEFAVKILSKELVREQKYEANVDREIRIMSHLAHENINRLVGLCENATNTYLVLEYAPKGDLHTHIASLGSLDTDSARFVAAEILRALEEIHRNHIVFVDLKPENVLIHASNHAKLSDFGSSRFFSEVGCHSAGGERLEGTAEYLAPEVLRGDGEAISPASDLWAFGCVLFQMLAGRTPILTDDDAHPHPSQKAANPRAAREAKLAAEKEAALEAAAVAAMSPAEKLAHRSQQMARHNDEQKAHLLGRMVAFERDARDDLFPDTFDKDARDLIEKILTPDPATRIGVRPAAPAAGVKWEIDYSVLKSHPFFAPLDFDRLPTLPAPSLASGASAPAPDATWARRKNSIMWAPMPKAYEFSAEGGTVMEAIQEDRAKEVAPAAPMASATSSGASSLRAQLFSNKTGSLAAPRFSSLKEGDHEGATGMEEGEEEGEDDEDDGDAADMSAMSSAPLPSASSSGSGPRRVRQASSRAAGPMAVVESTNADEEMGVVPASLPPRPAIRPSIGLRSQLPPSGPGGALPPKPSTMFASVPRADATAGPTGLGMGMRRMGGNSTAQALLSRIMAKPAAAGPAPPSQ